jgi:hypothetical protein
MIVSLDCDFKAVLTKKDHPTIVYLKGQGKIDVISPVDPGVACAAEELHSVCDYYDVKVYTYIRNSKSLV